MTAEALFPEFRALDVSLEASRIHLVTAGSGPPILLLHGYPETHAAWHKVAPLLLPHATVVIPDLPGYGDSVGPAPDASHHAHSKRSMAAQLVAMMEQLGHKRFVLAGHDRGGRVAYRLALDHPERVARLITLDMVPTLEMAESTSWRRALAAYHWFFLAQPAPLPERMIAADLDFYLEWTIKSWLGDPAAVDPRAMDEYRRCFRNPSVVKAMCEDYRAGLSIDLDHDRADRDAGKKIACPLLALWGERGTDGRPVDFLPVWRKWANDVSGGALRCGHFLMEEQPALTAQALIAALAT
jgi:haloacetate dehalogenase